jgi:hypothetical protein
VHSTPFLHPGLLDSAPLGLTSLNGAYRSTTSFFRMALWNLTCGKGTNMLLWRTGSYQFRVLEYKGEPAELLTNYDYILIERRYEGALRSAAR